MPAHSTNLFLLQDLEDSRRRGSPREAVRNPEAQSQMRAAMTRGFQTRTAVPSYLP
jgi:hypothetical protein